jgi:hypothetical protein
METLTIEGHLHGNGNVPLDVSSLTGGTMASSVQVDTAGTGLTYNGMALSLDFNLALTVTVAQTTKETAIEQRFHKLADQWRKETRHQSSASKMAMHPAYQQIIGMGREAVPFILQELKRTRGHWLWALFAITGEDPAPEGSTFAEAVDAWLSWGMQHGYATPD